MFQEEDLEEEIDLEEYGATLWPCLIMVVKIDNQFILEGDGYIEHIIEKCISEGRKAPY